MKTGNQEEGGEQRAPAEIEVARITYTKALLESYD